MVGGAAWALAAVQFVVAHVAVAAAWNPAYSWSRNHIGDLANTQCGLFSVPNGEPIYVCSPLHAVMNASFVLNGVLVIVGALLLWKHWPTGWLADTATVLWVMLGFGKILVGLAPENTNIGLHLVGCLNVQLGALGILLLSMVLFRSDPVLSRIGMVLAAIGLFGTVMGTIGEYAGTSLYLGLGSGGMQRVASYPSLVWLIMIGVVIAVRGLRNPLRV
ncbi:DUF998 domain-containing protein [Pseudonocardia sp. CA-142604]|uniref:DUF998 domain-containing protein n=1 Tax=Pseudonocardia sp. CA-142604 TaxID=3240024 RepID=UPI003D8FCE3C